MDLHPKLVYKRTPLADNIIMLSGKPSDPNFKNKYIQRKFKCQRITIRVHGEKKQTPAIPWFYLDELGASAGIGIVTSINYYDVFQDKRVLKVFHENLDVNLHPRKERVVKKKRIVARAEKKPTYEEEQMRRYARYFREQYEEQCRQDET